LVAPLAPLGPVLEPPAEKLGPPPLIDGSPPAGEPARLEPPLTFELPPATIDLPLVPPPLAAAFVSSPELQATSPSTKPAKRKRAPSFNEE
jgi:hypothetical protein